MRRTVSMLWIAALSAGICLAQGARASAAGGDARLPSTAPAHAGLPGAAGSARGMGASSTPHFRFSDSRAESSRWLRTATQLAVHSLGWCKGRCVRDNASPSVQQARLRPMEVDARFVRDGAEGRP